MKCPKCGLEVNNNEVFCPNCSSPLKVTADYDFIQAEIGGKVDQFLNNKQYDESEDEPYTNDSFSSIDFSDDTDFLDESENASDISKTKTRTKSVTGETITITRSIYGKDTIYTSDGFLNYPKDNEDDSDKERYLAEKEYRKKRAKARAIAKAKKKKRIIIISVIAAVLVVFGIVLAVVFLPSKNKQETAVEEDVIECSVKEGETYTTPLSINIASKNNNRLFYTTDGSEPSLTSYKYGQSIEITNKNIQEYVSGENNKVVLKIASYTQTSVKTASFSVSFYINKAPLEAPVITPGSGDYFEATYITISANENAKIYYTLDGTTPTASSSRYESPIPMKRGNYVLTAVAIDNDGLTSDTTSCVYNLTIEAKITYDTAYTNVLKYLTERAMITSDELSPTQEYKVPEGGIRKLTFAGEADVNNTNYLVFQVDYKNEDESVKSTTYIGVDDQSGNIVILSKNEDKFILG